MTSLVGHAQTLITLEPPAVDTTLHPDLIDTARHVRAAPSPAHLPAYPLCTLAMLPFSWNHRRRILVSESVPDSLDLAQATDLLFYDGIAHVPDRPPLLDVDLEVFADAYRG
jgi:hypothetical protein